MSPFENLPIELISNIFVVSISPTLTRLVSEEAEMPNYTRQAIRLSHINSFTRHTALSTALLWTYLHECMPVPCIDMFISRSGDCALTVRLWQACFRGTWELGRLWPSQSRWGRLFVDIVDFIATDSPPMEFPRLTELYVSGSLDRLDHEIREWTMPVLSKLRWRGFAPNSGFPSTITTLHYSHPQLYYTNILQCQQFLSSLVSVPSLIHLLIGPSNIVDIPLESNLEDVILHKLQTLQIRMQYAVTQDTERGVLFKIRAPQLCQLALNVHRHACTPILLSHFNHGGIFDLVRITLDRTVFSSPVYFPVLYRALPRLQHLTISCTSIDSEIPLDFPCDIPPVSVRILTFEKVNVDCEVLEALLTKMRKWGTWPAFEKLRLINCRLRCWDECTVGELTGGRFSVEKDGHLASPKRKTQKDYWSYNLIG